MVLTTSSHRTDSKCTVERIVAVTWKRYGRAIVGFPTLCR